MDSALVISAEEVVIMIGGMPPDPHYWKAEAERNTELLKSGRSTYGAVGVIVDLLLGFFGCIFSGLARLWQKRS